MSRLLKIEYKEFKDDDIFGFIDEILIKLRDCLEPAIRRHVETDKQVLILAFVCDGAEYAVVSHVQIKTLDNETIIDVLKQIESNFINVKFIKKTLIKNKKVYSFTNSNLLDLVHELDIIITKSEVKWIYPDNTMKNMYDKLKREGKL